MKNNPIDFEEWWANEGSGITPEWDHDMEDHAKVVAKAAWEFKQGAGTLNEGNPANKK